MNTKRRLEAAIKASGRAESAGSAPACSSYEAILRARTSAQQQTTTDDPLLSAVTTKLSRRSTTPLNSPQLLRDALGGTGTVTGEFDA